MPTTEKVRHLGAAELLDNVVDQGSFVSWDTPVQEPPLSGEYFRDLAKARDRSGTDESVITGAGLIRGRRVAVIVSEFSFLAGSIGHAAAQRRRPHEVAEGLQGVAPRRAHRGRPLAGRTDLSSRA